MAHKSKNKDNIERSHWKLYLQDIFPASHKGFDVNEITLLLKQKLQQLIVEKKKPNYVLSVLRTAKNYARKHNFAIDIKPKNLKLKSHRSRQYGIISTPIVIGVCNILQYAREFFNRQHEYNRIKCTILAIVISATTDISSQNIVSITTDHVHELFNVNFAVIDNKKTVVKVPIIFKQYYPFLIREDRNIIRLTIDRINKTIRELYIQLNRQTPNERLGLQTIQKINEQTITEFLFRSEAVSKE